MWERSMISKLRELFTEVCKKDNNLTNFKWAPVLHANHTLKYWVQKKKQETTNAQKDLGVKVDPQSNKIVSISNSISKQK